ncbi:MAG: hypothetical protein HY725_04735, partial [Candidatus Rokubacteria bacterium]|nr:hypothetical protein [Candidatus Rokubacteria bacterium]
LRTTGPFSLDFRFLQTTAEGLKAADRNGDGTFEEANTFFGLAPSSDPFVEVARREFIHGLHERLANSPWAVTAGGATTQIHEGSNLPVPCFSCQDNKPTLFATNVCVTNLLFPFVTNRAGFDTGLPVTDQAGFDRGTRLIGRFQNVPVGVEVLYQGIPVVPPDTQALPYIRLRNVRLGPSQLTENEILALGRSVVVAVGRSTLYTNAAGTAVAFGDVYPTGEIKGGVLVPANAQEAFLQLPGNLRTSNPLLIFPDQGQRGLFNLSLQQPYNPGGLGGNSRGLSDLELEILDRPRQDPLPFPERYR